MLFNFVKFSIQARASTRQSAVSSATVETIANNGLKKLATLRVAELTIGAVMKFHFHKTNTRFEEITLATMIIITDKKRP